jgi:hypothetical protein
VQNFQVTTEDLWHGCRKIILKTQILWQGTKYVEMQLQKSKNSVTSLPQKLHMNGEMGTIVDISSLKIKTLLKHI